MDEITVLAPATVANVVCGFDCMGFALEVPRDEMVVRRSPRPGVRIENLDEFSLPTNPEQNVAGVAIQALLDAARGDHGFEIESRKAIRPGSGIGSSSASACAAVFAANELLGRPFSKLDLVGFALEGEALASGSRHADNLAPCIFGGFTLVRSTEPLDIVEISFPRLFATIIHPQVEIRTSEARAMLPTEVPLKSAIHNWSNLGALVAGLEKGDYELIARSLEDVIVEPVRKRLIPMFGKIKAASLDAGALGGGISGSGPSVFMLSSSEPIAHAVAASMETIYSGTAIPYRIYVSEISRTGVNHA